MCIDTMTEKYFYTQDGTIKQTNHKIQNYYTVKGSGIGFSMLSNVIDLLSSLRRFLVSLYPSLHKHCCKCIKHSHKASKFCILTSQTNTKYSIQPFFYKQAQISQLQCTIMNSQKEKVGWPILKHRYSAISCTKVSTRYV